MMTENEKTAASALDDIRSGGGALIALARMRLDEAASALAEGRFTDAVSRLMEAHHKLKPLADAQAYIGGWDNYAVVRAHEVEIGWTLYGGHKVEGRELIDHGDHQHVGLTFEGGGEEVYEGSSELLIVMDPELPA